MRRAVLIASAVLCVLAPAAALARRPANAHERARIFHTYEAATHLHFPEHCLVYEISTPHTSWGLVRWAFDRRGRPLPGCGAYAADGLGVIHYRARRWRFVVSGDAGSPRLCHARSVPPAVIADLRLCR